VTGRIRASCARPCTSTPSIPRGQPGPGGAAAPPGPGWAQQASLPGGCLSEPAVLRSALEALTLRLDGSRAAANTVIRKRAVLHGALGYAAEAGPLPNNPLDTIAWQVPRSSAALDPMVVASPAQVSALLDAVARTRPEMTAFFGCLYYAALRPEEAVALRIADCHLPGPGWGMLRLAAATRRTAAAWTSSGTSHEQRGLKHRPDWTIRMWSQSPPVLAAMLRAHVTANGTAPDGRLFRGPRGGPLSESVYGRAWHSARTLALGPELAASGIARRPYDLRHAALSLGGDPARSPPGPGTASPSCSPSTATASTAKTTSSTSRSATSSSRPPDVVRARPWESQRLYRPRDGRGRRPLCVRGFPSRPADGPWTTPTLNGHTPKQQPLATVVFPDKGKY
jgi:integrase